MAENKGHAAEDEHRHMQRLKKFVILMLMPAIAAPVALCIVLLARISDLNTTLETLSYQLNDLSWVIEEQQQELEELTANFPIHRKAGPVVTNRQASWQGQTVYGDTEPVGAEQPGEPEQLGDVGQQLHQVYLTFDDGPSIYTDDILEILDRYGVKATFFVVGKESDSDKEALSMIVDGGHTLGMHSYTHIYDDLYQSVESFADDFVRLQSYLYEVTGVESKFYRFPGGSSNKTSDIDMREFADYLDSQGVQFYDWNISSGDAARVQLSVDALVRNSMSGIGERDVSIILFHDSADKRTTVEALPIIIERIQAMEDTVILPITEETVPIQHIH